MKILIIYIGTVDSEILKYIADALKTALNCKIELGGGMPIPHDSYNEKRRQYHSTAILREMRSLKLEDSDKLLGVTDSDLYVPELNFVFGEADISMGIAVISLMRLRQEFYELPPDRKIFHQRAVKEAIHEIGHTFNLSHCPNPKCIMHFSNTIADTDIKGPEFCNICKDKLILAP